MKESSVLRQMIEVLERILRHSSIFPAYSFSSFVFRCSDRPESQLATFCAVFSATAVGGIWHTWNTKPRAAQSRSQLIGRHGDRRP